MEYITNKKRLAEVGTFLGKMTDADYQTFMDIALNNPNVPQPKIMIEWTFKIDSPMGFKAGANVVYPIIASEWQDFLNDIPIYTTYTPNVYAVDGRAFTAPI